MEQAIIQITDRQIESAAARLHRQWNARPALRSLHLTRSQVRDLYVRDLLEFINIYIEQPTENGLFENPGDALDLEMAAPRLVQKWTAPARVSGTVAIRITEAQIARAVSKIRHAFQSDPTTRSLRLTCSQVRSLFMGTLVDYLETALGTPDRDGTVTDLARCSRRPADARLVAKYCTC